jgi:hypothetical protein
MEDPGLGYWLLRIAATVAGVLLVYAAAFTYPQERKGLRSRLEDWWLKLDEASGSALKQHIVFIRITAATAIQGFDWLFGPPLSTRFFIASGFLSMGSFAIGMLSFGDYGWAVPTGLVFFAGGIVVFALLIGRSQDKLAKDLEKRDLKYAEDLDRLFYPDPAQRLSHLKTPSIVHDARYWSDLNASLTSDYLYREQKSWWEDLLSPDTTSNIVLPVIFATLAASSTGLVFAGAREKGVDENVFILALITAFVCDMICVLVTVYFLEKISRAGSAVTAAGFFLVDALVAAAMLAVPWILFTEVVAADTKIAHYLIFVAAANISTAAPSVVFLLVAITALAHRIFWPLILRPFYNLIHAENILKPRTLGVAGLTCFSVWLEIPESYEAAFREFLGLL